MRFFQDIYGVDLLSLTLLFLSSLLNLFNYTRIMGYFLFFIAIFRILSKKIYKRRTELYAFIGFINKFLNKFGFTIPSNIQPFGLNNLFHTFKIVENKLNEKKNFKITKCPKCGQKLRLPRKKGEIVVNCKRCSYKFDFKT